MKLLDYINFVKSQALFHKNRAARATEERVSRNAAAMSRRFNELAEEIESLRGARILIKPVGIDPLNITRDDVEGLPEELLQHLVNVPDQDSVDSLIIRLIDDAGGRLLLDHILVGVYRETGQIFQRAQMVSRLHRLNKRGLVESTGRKGVYASAGFAASITANQQEAGDSTEIAQP